MDRRNNFDGLRLIAAMMVVLSHMASLGGEREWQVQGVNWGLIGVACFFAISGYLVLGSWRSDPDIGRFLHRRYLRIAPALLVVMPLSFALVAAMGLRGFPDNPVHLLNGSLWTIYYEVTFYLLLPAAAILTKRVTLTAVSLLVGIYVAFPTYLMLENPAFFFYFGVPFAVGLALMEYPVLRRWWWAISGLGIACLPLHPASIGLIVAPLVIWIGTRSWPLLREAGRYGDLSYGIYIWAWPIQQTVIALLGHETGYWYLISVALPLILALAWLSWRLVEAPALSRKPRRADRPGHVNATTPMPPHTPQRAPRSVPSEG